MGKCYVKNTRSISLVFRLYYYLMVMEMLFLCRDFLKTIHAVVRLVVVPDTLPALLSAVRLWKISRIAERPPACDSVIHNVVDLSQLPLFRFVIIMPQCFLIKLFGTDHAAGIAFQIV